MWSNNGFNGGPFQNNFNQNGFPQMPFYSPPVMMNYNQVTEDEPMNGDSPLDLAYANHSAFMQNQNVAAQAFPSPSLSNQQAANVALSSTSSPLHMGARAAELRAQLLKNKVARNNSATPPVPKTKLAAGPVVEEAEHTSASTPRVTDEKHEQDLNDLISEYSIPKATIEPHVKIPATPDIGKPLNKDATSLEANLIRTTPIKPAILPNAQNGIEKAKTQSSRHISHGSMSEGEIMEDIVSINHKTSPRSTKERSLSKLMRPEHQVQPQTARSKQVTKQVHPQPSRDESRQRTPPPAFKPPVSNSFHDRHPDIHPKKDNRPYRHELNGEQKQNVDSERQLPRREIRQDQTTMLQRSVVPAPQEQDNHRLGEAEPLSLESLLPIDRDLREWLDITGYHNTEYRSKILTRRRAIAQLDAERLRLVAEMESEERGPAPRALIQPAQIATSMLPPALPTPVVPAPQPERDQIASNKRRFSEYRESQEAVVGDRRVLQRTRSVEPDRRPRRLSPGRRYDDNDEPPRPRFGGRSPSPGRAQSPPRQAYEGRARERGYEMDNYYDDRDNVRDRSYRDRGYIPSGRGRGRGRGFGDFNDHRDPTDTRNDPQFGTKIANSKPYRDGKGLNRGGRGDTRYFIVKSFNEENVIKCIEDSVWTTQIQNDDIFREAFETCQNVILVFSINRSRAFQGYARMESLPGSVEVPEWQKSINWESTGAFRVRWLVICSTKFNRVGHLKNSLNDNQAVLIGKDGQEIEEECGAGLIEIIDEEAEQALEPSRIKSEERFWNDHY